MRYWDKVVLADGRKGYVVRNYLTQIADITNCNENTLLQHIQILEMDQE